MRVLGREFYLYPELNLTSRYGHHRGVGRWEGIYLMGFVLFLLRLLERGEGLTDARSDGLRNNLMLFCFLLEHLAHARPTRFQCPARASLG